MSAAVNPTVISASHLQQYQDAVIPLVEHWQVLRSGGSEGLLTDQAFATAVQDLIRERDALGYQGGKPPSLVALGDYAASLEKHAGAANAPKFEYAEAVLTSLASHELIPLPDQPMDAFCAGIAQKLAAISGSGKPPLHGLPSVRFADPSQERLPVVTDFASGNLVVSAISESGQEVAVISRFRPEKKLGSGAFGSVYSGRAVRRDRRTGAWPSLDGGDPDADFQRVAIKFNSGASPAMIDREIEALEWVGERSSNFPRLIDSGYAVGLENQPVDFIVMSLIKGRPFRFSDFIGAAFQPDGEPNAKMSRLLNLFEQIAGILWELSDKFGFVHKDLKPDNFMTREIEGSAIEVKLIDLGCASQLGEEWTKIAGTLLYLPDECLETRHYSAASQDIYALGVMIYEALSGGKPFAPPLEIVQRIARTPSERDALMLDTILSLKAAMGRGPAPIAPERNIPPTLENLVRRILSKDPAHRPSAQRIRFTLRALRAIDLFERAQREPNASLKARLLKKSLEGLNVFKRKSSDDAGLMERADQLEHQIGLYCLQAQIVI